MQLLYKLFPRICEAYDFLRREELSRRCRLGSVVDIQRDTRYPAYFLSLDRPEALVTFRNILILMVS